MPAETQLVLVMEYHRMSGRYRIKNAGKEIIQFPEEDRICEIWDGMFPDTFFSVGSTTNSPISGLWVDVGSGTTPDIRSNFCNALALECAVMPD